MRRGLAGMDSSREAGKHWAYFMSHPVREKGIRDQRGRDNAEPNKTTLSVTRGSTEAGERDGRARRRAVPDSSQLIESQRCGPFKSARIVDGLASCALRYEREAIAHP